MAEDNEIKNNKILISNHLSKTTSRVHRIVVNYQGKTTTKIIRKQTNMKLAFRDLFFLFPSISLIVGTEDSNDYFIS